MKTGLIENGRVMAIDAGCDCTYIYGYDVHFNVVILEGNACQNWPNCHFPMERARCEAEILLDAANCVAPTFEMKSDFGNVKCGL